MSKHTPLLPVSGVLESPGKLTLTLAAPYKPELGLTHIVIIQVPNGPVKGDIIKKLAQVFVNPQLFAALDAWASSEQPLYVSLAYDGTKVKDIVYTRLIPVAASTQAEAMEEHLDAHLGSEAYANSAEAKQDGAPPS